MKIRVKYDADVYRLLDDNPIFYGYCNENLRLARKLLDTGVSPDDLQKIKSNLQLAYDIVLKQVEETYNEVAREFSKKKP